MIEQCFSAKKPSWSFDSSCCKGKLCTIIIQLRSIGTSIIRLGFWGPLYYTYNKEPTKIVGNDLGPHIRLPV